MSGSCAPQGESHKLKKITIYTGAYQTQDLTLIGIVSFLECSVNCRFLGTRKIRSVHGT